MGIAVSLIEPAFVKSEIFKKTAEHTQTAMERGRDGVYQLYDRFRTPEKVRIFYNNYARERDHSFRIVRREMMYNPLHILHHEVYI